MAEYFDVKGIIIGQLIQNI